MSPKLKLYVGFYKDSSPERNEENLACLKANAANPHIDEIWLFVEKPEDFQHLATDKIRITRSRTRWCTYFDFISHANRESEDFLLLIANTDIYFDETLEIAKSSIKRGELVVMGRRDIRPDGTAYITEHLESSDAWLMAAPVIDFPCEYRLGTVGCESTFLGSAQSAGLRLRPATMSVNAYHLHITQKRNIDPGKDRFFDSMRMVFPVPAAIARPRPTKKAKRAMVDMGCVGGAPLSIARAWLNIISCWTHDSFRENLVVLSRGFDNLQSDRLTVVRGSQLNTFLPSATAHMLEGACKEHEIDLFLSSCYDSPLDTPTAAFIHDMTAEAAHGSRDRITSGDFSGQKYRIITQAERIFAWTAQTEREILDLFPRRAAGKTAVVPLGLSDDFRRASDADIRAFKEKYKITKPYYLTVGARTGYCNHNNADYFFRALGQLPGKDGVMVVSLGGEENFDEVNLSLLNGVQAIRIEADERELQAAYSGALALVYPVVHSGLCYPVLEAMRCGCPVIASNRGAVGEVSGGHIFSFDLTNQGAFKELVEAVRDPSVRHTHQHKAYEHSLKFSWQKTADQLRDHILEMLGC